MPPPKKYPKSLRKKGALRTVARCHADTASVQPKEYWNDVCPIEWGAMEKYEVRGARMTEGERGRSQRSVGRQRGGPSPRRHAGFGSRRPGGGPT
jgi:hypothetical protein